MMKPIDAKIWGEYGEQICLNDHPVCQFCFDVVYCVQKGLLGNIFDYFSVIVFAALSFSV